MAIPSRITLPFGSVSRPALAILIWTLLVCVPFLTTAQTVIFSNPGTSYPNTDEVVFTTYNVPIDQCSSISFSLTFNFSFGWPGSGNMESNDECPFAPAPCDGNPDPAFAETGSCADCWDFLYVQYQIDGVTLFSRLIGVPGDLAQSGTITFGPVCAQNGSTATILVSAQTWASNENVTTSAISVTCWEAMANPTANPNPACAGQPINLTGNLVNPPSVGSVNWTGPGTITPPNQANTTVTNAPLGTNTYTLTLTDDNNCTETATVDVQVEPGPTVDNPGNQAVCPGADVSVMFTGTATDYNWTNNNPAIGLGASGTGNIDFPAANVTNPTTATITVTPVSGPCTGTPITFTITISPGPSMNAVNNVVQCSGSFVSVNFLGAPFGTTYEWTNDNTNIGLGDMGVGNLNFPSASVAMQEVANIVVTPVNALGCEGPPRNFTITINPIAAADDPGDLVVCAGEAIQVEFMGTGINYNWTSTNSATGIPNSGSGNIDEVANNVTQQEVTTVSVTATGACPGPPIQFTVTVQPASQVNTVANVVACSGQMVGVNFTTVPAGITPTWTNSNTAIGLGAAGTGNLNFNAAIVSTPTVATITVQAVQATCSGPSTTFTVTINPGPTMNAVSNLNLCAGDNIAAAFGGAGTGATYSWTNNNANIGLGASGTGSINVPSANVTTTQTATITVTPSLNGCTGTPRTFTVTVNPVPTVTQPANLTLCAGEPVAVNFSGTTGANFNWANNNTAIGLGASGTGNIGFPIPANLAANQTATITVTPQLGTCPGTPVNFTITGNVPPTLTVGSVLCAPNLLSYTVTVTSNATALTATAGTVTAVAGGFSIANIPAGTNVSMTATLNGCTTQTTVNAPNCNCPPVAAASNPNNPSICQGAAIPALTATAGAGLEMDWFAVPSGGTALVTNTGTFTPTGPFTPGTYTFYVETRDPLTGCVSATRTPVVLTVNATPTVDAVINVTVCAGGAVAVNFAGTSGATFDWTNSNPNIGLGGSGTGNIGFNAATNLTNTEIGNLTVTPHLGTCLGTPTNFTITVNPVPTITAGTPQCAPDLQTYSVTVTTTNANALTASAGTITGTNNSYTVTAIPAGTNITLNASSAAACVAQQQTVTAPNCNCPPVDIATNPSNPTICEGATIPALSVMATVGLQVDWYANATGGAALLSNSNTFTPAGPLLAGTYTFFAETRDPATGCVSANRTPVVLTVNPTPSMLTPVSATVCAGNQVQVTFNGTAGATYSWTNSNTNIGIGAAGNGNISFTPPSGLTNNETANFTATPALGNCNGPTVNFTITAVARPVITLGTIQCSSDLTTYSVTVTVTNSTTMTSNGGTVTGSNGNYVVNNIPAGTNVILTASATNNCNTTQFVTAPNCNCPPVAAASNPNNPTVCENSPLPSLSVTAATGLVVDWYLAPSGGTAIVSGASSLVPPGPGTLPAGTYTFYAETRDPATGCVSATRTPVVLTVLALPTMSAPVNLTVCADQSVIVNFNGTASAQFNWTNNNPNIGLGGSGSGNIAFTVNADIENQELANIQVTPVLGACTGNPVNFTITANPIPTLDLTLIQCDNSLTTYFVEIESNANSLTASAGTVVNNGDGTFTVSNIPEGTDVVLVGVGANGCITSQNVTSPNCNCPPVAAPTNPSNPTICVGAPVPTLTVSAGTGLQVNWFSTPAGGTALATNTTSFLPNINTSTPGTFNFYAETFNPQTNCSSTGRTAVVVTIVALPVAAINGPAQTCAGTPATLTASGGNAYVWSTSATAASISVSPLVNTIYTVTVTNANQCTATATYTLVVNLPFFVTINALTCDPTQVGTLTQNLTTVTGCDSTVQTITTLDPNGCAPVVALQPAPASCVGNDDGSFELVVSAGFGPFDYAWAGNGLNGSGQIQLTVGSTLVEDLVAGTYTVTVTDNNGVSTTATVTVGAPTPIIPTAQTQVQPNGFGVSCAGGSDGSISVAATGGTPNYTYQWSNGNLDQTVNGLAVGTYTVTVTDSNGCTATASTSVDEPPALALDITAKAVDCGDEAQTFTVTPTGGSGPFTYRLDGVVVAGPRIEVPAGAHMITVLDNAGCATDTSVMVTLPIPTLISLLPEQVVGLGEPVDVGASTNIAVWDTIVWSPLRDTARANTLSQQWLPLQSEILTVTITDTAGCTATATTRILVKSNVDIYVPNVFDPTSLGENSVWKIYGDAGVELLQKVHIFDRWGSSIYLWDEPVALDQWPGWDGLVDNKKANPAVFVYYIQVKLKDGRELLLSGDVTVVR